MENKRREGLGRRSKKKTYEKEKVRSGEKTRKSRKAEEKGNSRHL